MWQRHRLSHAARQLKPLRQGDLDGLCGLYAIINALRVAVYPDHVLRRPELRRLFRAGVVELGRTRKLRSIVSDGMDDPLWLKLCDTVVADANLMLRGTLGLQRVTYLDARPTTREAVRGIKRSIRDGRPVLVALLGSYDHYTVVVGFNATRLTLFDSYGYRWIRIDSVAVENSPLEAPHRINPTTSLAIGWTRYA